MRFGRSELVVVIALGWIKDLACGLFKALLFGLSLSVIVARNVQSLCTCWHTCMHKCSWLVLDAKVLIKSFI